MITDEERAALIARAREARERAYAPYSNYKVGSSLLGESGRIYTGANVENAAFPSSMCAERTAVYHAVSQGERKFRAMVVFTSNGGSPCGACRQALSEFGMDMLVITADVDGNFSEKPLSELLPGAFGAADLHTGKH